MKNKFAFIGHPNSVHMLHDYMALHRRDYSDRKMNDTLLKKLFEWTPSFRAFDIELDSGINGEKTCGAFYVATFLPEMLVRSPDIVIAKIEGALRAAEKDGMTVAALGALTSIADSVQGEKVSGAVNNMSVTNGTTFTSALVIESINRVCTLMDMDIADMNLAVIGATGSIGRTCSRYFLGKTKKMTLTGRKEEKLLKYFGSYSAGNIQSVQLTTDNKAAVMDADIVISVTSSIFPIFESGDFKSGAVVCDVGFPKNISHSCTDRHDILVYSGGLAQIPGKIENATLWGLPADDIIYGCFSESMVIAMEGCMNYCTVGHSDIPMKNLKIISDAANRHRFKLAPFFNDSGFYTEEDFRSLYHVIGKRDMKKTGV